MLIFFFLAYYSLMTLTVADTETETDDRYIELNKNLCCHLSLCSVDTILYNPFFIQLSLGLGYCQCNDTINDYPNHLCCNK